MMEWINPALVLAQETAAPGAGLDSFLRMFGPVILILVVFMWLTHRSQKKKDQQRQQMLDSIKPKDRVVTIGGIHGRVVSVKDNAFVLRVDEDKDVRITVSKGGVSRRVTGEEKDDEE